MLDATQKQLIKDTVPVLKMHGLTLTKHFYARMFAHNPEMLEVFNQGNQSNGSQQQALAMAVAAYAEHIENPSVLMPVLERISAKHVSLGIRREHYAVVGKHLLASIAEVLGGAATPALIDAWAGAYGQLADILANKEQQLYSDATEKTGSWTGWRTFRVQSKHPESEEIYSFELMPADGGPVPVYRAGQYVSVRSVVPALGYRQARQYTLSDAPGKPYLQISVKRESSKEAQAQGLFSNYLHDQVHEGSLIEVAAPAGDFYLHEDRQSTVILLSAGIGITPMMSMLAQLQQTAPHRPVRFLHAARHAGVHAFSGRVHELLSGMQDARSWTAHEHNAPQTLKGVMTRCDAMGRLDVAELAFQDYLSIDGDYYICGPKGFMSAQIAALHKLGVNSKNIHTEVFGTGGVADAP
jgi:nitric oxide dioxygenase